MGILVVGWLIGVLVGLRVNERENLQLEREALKREKEIFEQAREEDENDMTRYMSRSLSRSRNNDEMEFQ